MLIGKFQTVHPATTRGDGISFPSMFTYSTGSVSKDHALAVAVDDNDSTYFDVVIFST
jgi:hypothetical protein